MYTGFITLKSLSSENFSICIHKPVKGLLDLSIYWGKRQIYYVIVVIYKHAGETFWSRWIKDDKHTSFRTSGMTTFLNVYLTKLDLCK